MTRLGRDKRGNVIAIAAAALIPLAGLIGGGVDMSRLYLTKTRLQQACDAGALAGRKAMGSGSWTEDGATTSEGRAEELFRANFQDGAYGTDLLSQSFTEDDGEVTGAAVVSVPMTIMKIFGVTERTMTVTCTAKMEIPNTDVMFVLDVTGSMNCPTGSSSCSNNGNVPAYGARITGLKSAVKCFYEALLRVNTTENCGNDPTATTYSGTAQIRMGFVPYSVNVNVGKLLHNDWMADEWSYQSREYGLDGTYSQNTNAGHWNYISGSRRERDASSCRSDTYSSQTTESTPVVTTESDGTIITVYKETRSETGRQYDCPRRGDPSYMDYDNYVTERTVTITRTPNYSYTYKQIPFDVSGLKNGDANWNDSIALPVGTRGGNTDVTWDGCIEERATAKNSDKDPSDEWNPIPSTALDLNIDMVPSTAGSHWGPMLKDAVWGRYTGNNTNNRTQNDVVTSSNLNRNNDYYCSTEAKKLQTWYTPGGFVSYVNSLRAIGNTYHDIGMIWGARIISPTGIFASENAETATGGAIQRHLIFMTDGATQTGFTNYTAYGLPWWDRRQTTYAPDNGNLNDILNTRLVALCTAIRNRNITLWVVSYGGDVDTDTEERLENCATPGKYFKADDTPTLIGNFKQIASEIADLRLTN